ncbi:MAG: 1-deoxy-D-xylulose-5-phosphate reductoisomerase [Gammaproteobacteria bacterium]|uniref:1-deoxy-D-xylulose-5-phosphate reductoisomerase n=1 Tax=Hydrogenophaga sp. TaxID=1904254 RepID=UPI0025C0C9D0|nr:1-deoxy-D-xylulose-5-phosphate reductoisomerase [Hydrogenophaga sp.]MBU4180520.1 1-deoxy-D-xylulose-5-phosphate reductoisomerase [Gammaproteobacteria bacterium]MBU4279547.1 1-deoxy-D-xylulose-5-phosphate reductoisomerase [Gammaproteobacteria bacterium]MBU4323001.1 1-deoxy-D-xylulose-5-phosphate reductoisomerase [Gammaproteobacteria bacterium]MBU4508079.1 1-deoxy-D-xylulose-5-phosphate reductoisomerase [Gammaproteobacteria bacterium]MCG2657054.1 1-deoxy-D-xylulose-5-phosphate reductoisomeras
MTAFQQNITILGSTGSIGTSTLDVIARHPDRYRVFALTAATQVEMLLQQCQVFSPRYAVMASAPHAAQLAARVKELGLSVQVLAGDRALCEVSSDPEVHAVMAAIVGAAGLAPSLAAAQAGKKLLLANKEALVVGGELFMRAVREGGATLLPIDSEHSAVFQSLPEDSASWERRVEKIVLTASGGPFRQRDPQTLHLVTPEEACAHPNWVMGRKISVDSATMMNKALEVIEARYLFGLAPAQIEVVIHPQSVIHSMVQYHDRSVVAQLGTPDMRVPIAYGLSWPERIASGAAALDFSTLGALSFEKPDDQRFPGLRLAWESLAGPVGTTAVLNAANEVAVAAFLDRRLRFDQIHAVNHATLGAMSPSNPVGLGDLMAIDAEARAMAGTVVARCAA